MEEFDDDAFKYPNCFFTSFVKSCWLVEHGDPKFDIELLKALFDLDMLYSGFEKDELILDDITGILECCLAFDNFVSEFCMVDDVYFNGVSIFCDCSNDPNLEADLSQKGELNGNELSFKVGFWLFEGELKSDNPNFFVVW